MNSPPPDPTKKKDLFQRLEKKSLHLSEKKIRELLPLATRINLALKLRHYTLRIPHPRPQTLKRSINQFKWDMAKEWSGKFSMLPKIDPDDESKSFLLIKFHPSYETLPLEFNGVLFDEPLDIDSITTRVITIKSKQTRFSRRHIPSSKLEIFQSLSSTHLLTIDDDWITFTPLNPSEDHPSPSPIESLPPALPTLDIPDPPVISPPQSLAPPPSSSKLRDLYGFR